MNDLWHHLIAITEGIVAGSLVRFMLLFIGVGILVWYRRRHPRPLEIIGPTGRVMGTYTPRDAEEAASWERIAAREERYRS